MRRHSLTAELRKTFVSILGAVLAATTLTYALGVWLLFWGEDRFLRPENYAEQVIDEAEGLIDQDGVQILTSKGEEQIQQLIDLFFFRCPACRKAYYGVVFIVFFPETELYFFF